MILLDASVLFDFQRGKDAKLTALVPTLPCCVCGATRSEALKGANDPARRAGTLQLLGTFPAIRTPEAVWDELGDHLAALRRAGLVIPYADVLVATVGIHHGIEVWARDHHFPMMLPVLPGLRLFAEPP